MENGLAHAIAAETGCMTLTEPLNAPSTTKQSESPLGAPEVLKCKTTADFLAALPRVVGFTATDSLFLLLFSGKQSGGTLRIDLPPDESPQATAPFLDGICNLLASLREKHGYSSPAIVITSSQSFAEAQGHPWRRLARRLERRLARDGDRVRELCCIAPDGWVSYLDPAAPRLGRSLDEIAASPFAVPGEAVQLDDIGSFGDPPADEAAKVQEILSLNAGTWPDQGSSGLTPTAEMASLAAALVAPTELDVQAIAGLIRVADTEAGWLVITEQLSATAEAFLSDEALQHSTEPQRKEARQRLKVASERLVHVVTLAPRELRPAIISACALAWWLRGMQSVAHKQLLVAAEIDSDHKMVGIVRRLFEDMQYPMIPLHA